MYLTGKEEVNAVADVILSMDYFRYSGGHQANAFESVWANFIGSKEAIMLTSGTSALQVALAALGIGPGDSVLIPAYTYIATALAVTSVGAIPITVEVDEQLTMDPADVARKIRRHTKAIIPVHMVGMPCHMGKLKRLAKAHKIAIIEDCCQAAGGSFGKKRLGAIGDAGAYSFNQFKIISCGEGGACTINNKAILKRARSASDGGLCVWDEGKDNDAVFCAPNYRGNNINAAILLEQVKRLDGILAKLRANRQRLMEQIQLPTGASFVRSHDEAGNCGVCFLIQCKDVEQAAAVEKVIKHHTNCYRPINSGRHVYSDWVVIKEKRGGHHHDWDCFKHPKNQKIKTNYHTALKQSDDYLARTVLVRTPFNATARDLNKMAKQISLNINA